MTHVDTSMSDAIEAHGLEKSYRGGVKALRGVSFSVRKGTIFSLLGPNGAGKSTTLRILTTLSSPDAGEARVAGLDVVRQQAQVRLAIGYVSQKSAVDLAATGYENLALQGQLYGMRKADIQTRADELLDRFGLSGVHRRITQTYSGGMLRKLDVAMGLMHRPDVLFLDEPTTGLDPESRQAMWREIRRLGREEGLTVLLTTHYLDEADFLAERIAIVDQGRVAVEGTPDDLKRELKGDTVRVELVRPVSADTLRMVATELPALRELRCDGKTLRARVDSGERALPALLARLDACGATVAAATVARPSLDDVYLHHTGRVYLSQEEASPKCVRS